MASKAALAAAAAALAALLAAPRAARADANDPDPWLGRDKALHFSLSAAIAGGGYAAGAACFPHGYAGPVLLGSGLAISAGAAKELYDLSGHGDPSWRDFTWDVLGTAVGIGVAVLIHAATGGPSPEPRAPGATRSTSSALQLRDATFVARW